MRATCLSHHIRHESMAPVTYDQECRTQSFSLCKNVCALNSSLVGPPSSAPNSYRPSVYNHSSKWGHKFPRRIKKLISVHFNLCIPRKLTRRQNTLHRIVADMSWISFSQGRQFSWWFIVLCVLVGSYVLNKPDPAYPKVASSMFLRNFTRLRNWKE